MKGEAAALGVSPPVPVRRGTSQSGNGICESSLQEVTPNIYVFITELSSRKYPIHATPLSPLIMSQPSGLIEINRILLQFPYFFYYILFQD